mmetsp:Transcript_21607/g.69550  ORF Transcript_21607/g.69550 Transcript_21607/m.69550 type:complete len:296 (+) Transcript_21607:747-1634(+)
MGAGVALDAVVSLQELWVEVVVADECPEHTTRHTGVDEEGHNNVGADHGVLVPTVERVHVGSGQVGQERVVVAAQCGAQALDQPVGLLPAVLAEHGAIHLHRRLHRRAVLANQRAPPAGLPTEPPLLQCRDLRGSPGTRGRTVCTVLHAAAAGCTIAHTRSIFGKDGLQPCTKRAVSLSQVIHARKEPEGVPEPLLCLHQWHSQDAGAKEDQPQLHHGEHEREHCDGGHSGNDELVHVIDALRAANGGAEGRCSLKVDEQKLVEHLVHQVGPRNAEHAAKGKGQLEEGDDDLHLW